LPPNAHARATGNRYSATITGAALRRKLGADGGIGDYVTKPKGMHWRTFERAMERIDRAEGIVDGHTVLLLDRLNRITSR
jgi:hypothetical protein